MSMKDLKDFNLTTEITVRWADMDVFKHVNNAEYVRWVECARVEYLMKIAGDLKGNALGPILARTDIRYIFPITFPDTVIVGFRVMEIRDDRLICECKIFSKKYERLSAIAYNTIMAYDFNNLRKTDIPIEWVMNIQDFEK
jgi:acyl-CoA thioester hydrolase